MIKINKEYFNKLNQLDRIEFMLKKNKIDELNGSSGLPSFIYDMTVLLLLLIVISFILYTNGFIEQAIIIVSIMQLASKLLVLGIIIIIGIELIIYVIYYKKNKELLKEYFDVKVKTRKNK
jgi:hypothetical protein